MMEYDVVDLLERAIETTKKRKEMYSSMVLKDEQSERIKILKMVLRYEENKNIKLYENFKKEVLEYKESYQIDMNIYEKVSFLINKFSSYSLPTDISDPKELVNFYFTIQKEMLASFISMQEQFVDKEETSENLTSRIISKIIEEKEENIQEIERFRKNHSM